MASFKQWVKADKGPFAHFLRAAFYGFRRAEIPVLPLVHSSLYRLHKAITGSLGWLTRVLYWTPLFKSRLSGNAPDLYLYGGLPFVTGPLEISIGRRCNLSAATTFSGRWCSQPQPRLMIGNNVGIGWQTTLAVGSRIELGDNVRIAGRSFLAGYPGHPLDAKTRAAGLPDLDNQVGPIVLEDSVWLGTGVYVMAGVTIGRGTVVAAGSIVTKNLPANVLAAGNPARVIRILVDEDQLPDTCHTNRQDLAEEQAA